MMLEYISLIFNVVHRGFGGGNWIYRPVSKLERKSVKMGELAAESTLLGKKWMHQTLVEINISHQDVSNGLLVFVSPSHQSF